MMKRFNLLGGFITIYALILLVTIYFAFEITSQLEQMTDYTGEITTHRASAPEYSGNWNEDDTLLFVTGEYPPYVYSKDGELKGISYDAFVDILEAMGVNYRIEFMSWSRGLALLDSGQAFATFPYAISDDRLTHYLFSEPFQIEPDKSDYFYGYDVDTTDHSAVKFDSLNTLNDLKDLKVGGIYGYYYLESLEELGLEVDLSVDEKECLEKMKDGRIDVAIFDPRVADYMISEYYAEDAAHFTKLSLSMKPNQVGDHLMLNRKNAYAMEFIEKFNQTIITNQK